MLAFYKEKTFTTSDGSKINYVDEGRDNKSTYLFVHGWCSKGTDFAKIGKELIKTYRVVWMDHRGHGKTISNGPYTLKQVAADLKDLIEYLELEDVIFVGYSMGAHVLFQYVRDYGSLHLSKAAIIDMSPKLLNDADWKHGLYQGHYLLEHYERDKGIMRENFPEFGGFFFGQVIGTHHPDEVRDYKGKFIYKLMSRFVAKKSQYGMLADFWEQMLDNDYREDLKNINIPLAIIYSRPGSIYEEGAAQYIHSQVPDGTLYPVDGCGHMLVMSKGKEILTILRKFAGKQ